MGLVRKRLKLIGSKGEAEVEALFDTGASYSCIRPELAERLAHVEPLRRPKELGTADENTTVRVTARVALDFELDGVVLSDEFMVVPNLRREVIIGAKTMQAWRIKVDMEKEQIIFDPRVGELWLLWLGL